MSYETISEKSRLYLAVEYARFAKEEQLDSTQGFLHPNQPSDFGIQISAHATL